MSKIVLVLIYVAGVLMAGCLAAIFFTEGRPIVEFVASYRAACIACVGLAVMYNLARFAPKNKSTPH